MKSLTGLGVALVTPFDENLAIDFTALEKLLNHLYQSKAVDYIVALGSTGEASTLNREEKQAVIAFIKDFNRNRLPLIFGHSGNNTAQLVRELKEIDTTGYDAILSASPAYIKPTQKGIIAHYQHLADNAPLPLILYNVPSRTCSNMQASTTIELSKHKNIIGIKEASGDVELTEEIRKNTDRSFIILSGDDMLTVPLIAAGAAGLISVLGNAYPAVFKEIINYGLAGDFKMAENAASKIIKINDLMYEEGNPVGIKQLLAHLGLCKPYVRLPLLSAGNELSAQIKDSLL